MSHNASRSGGKTAAELKRRAGLLVLSVLLAAASVAALLAPGWGIKLGTLVGGGNQVVLSATAISIEGQDTPEVTADDIKQAADQLKTRAGFLQQKGVEVSQDGNDILVRVPGSYDAASVASLLSGRGKVEFVRVDTISDADALSRINNGSTGVPLAAGSYEAFATSDDVTDAKVVTTDAGKYYGISGLSQTIYAVGITLDSDSAQTLADVTGELAEGSGKLALVVDGTIVSAPAISSKIEGGELTISGGFTADQAAQLAGELKSGPLGITLTASDPEGFGGYPVAFAAGSAVVLVLSLVLAHRRLFGRAGFVCLFALLFSVVFQLGILAVMARFDLVILGTWELGGIAFAAVMALAGACRMGAAYASQREGGSSVRKAQIEACGPAIKNELKIWVFGTIVFCVAGFLVPSAGPRELAWACVAGMAADLVACALVTRPLLCVFTAADANVARELPGADVANDAEKAEDAHEADAAPTSDEA